MKFLIVLFLFNIYNTEADQDVIIEVSNTTGEYWAGEVPVPWAVPNKDDETETKNLKLVLELARRMAPVGVHELPPFDPYSGPKNKIVQIVGLPGVEGSLNLSSLVITGLAGYDFSELLVQSSRLSIPMSKLINYVVSIPWLKIKGNVKASVSIGGGKPEVLTATMSGIVKGITNIVDLGLVPLSQKKRENSYEVSGIEVQSNIDSLKVKFTNIRSLTNRRRARDQVPKTEAIADAVTAMSTKIMVQHLNQILGGVTVEQVDDFLLPKSSNCCN